MCRWHSLKFKIECVFMCVCVPYPALSEVVVSGTLLRSECMVFLCWSHSTWYFHHPKKTKREVSVAVIKNIFCMKLLIWLFWFDLGFFLTCFRVPPSQQDRACVCRGRRKEKWPPTNRPGCLPTKARTDHPTNTHESNDQKRVKTQDLSGADVNNIQKISKHWFKSTAP